MNDELDRLQEELNRIQAQIDKMLEQDKKTVTERYKPVKGEEYFSFGPEEHIRGYHFDDDMTDDHLLSIGDVFRTREEATKALARQQAYIRMVDKIAELNASVEWVCDWDDRSQAKVYLHLDHIDEAVSKYTASEDQIVPSELHFPAEIESQVLKECSDDFKIWLGVEW